MLLENTAGATVVTASSPSTIGGKASLTVFAATPGMVVIRAITDVTLGGALLHRETGLGSANSPDARKDWVWHNEPPTAESLPLVTCRNTLLAFSLRGYDANLNPADPDSHPLTFAILGAPASGALSGSLSAVTYRAPHEASVNVVYTPQFDFLGTDRITYIVTDPMGAFALGMIQIMVVDCGEEIAGGGGALGPRIVINEVAWGGTEADPMHEWIELYSSFDELLDLTGWTLRWRRKQPEGVLDQYVKVVELRGTIDPYGFYLMERRTDDVVSDIAADLIYDDTGPIVINEIAWGGTAASSDDQWIELMNVTENAVDLTGWTLRWRLTQATTAAEREWKVVELRGSVAPASAYLLERGSDEVVRDIPADLVYDLALDPRGEVLELLDPTSKVVDTVNADPRVIKGWAAGSPEFQSMERISLFAPDTLENWYTNTGLIVVGKDAKFEDLKATPRSTNEGAILYSSSWPTFLLFRTSQFEMTRYCPDPNIRPRVRWWPDDPKLAQAFRLEYQEALGRWRLVVDAKSLEPGEYRVAVAGPGGHYCLLHLIVR